MTTRPVSRLLLGTVLVVFLTGCQNGQGFLKANSNDPDDAASAQTTPSEARSARIVDRDVEAPEVFQVADLALWDGRPSLGGVWVASPDVTDPERVIMRNTANGKFVIGALFKRERDNPGPVLQISSDAADALGILAGQPVKLSVTALRREEGPDVNPDASAPLLNTAEVLPTENTDPTTSAAAAAIDKATKKPAAPAEGVQTSTLPAKPAKEATAAPQGTAVATAPAPAAPVAPATASGRTIQIGIFSVEANAKRAVEALSKAGIAAQISTETSKGKTFWSVTAKGGSDVLGKAKSAGFKDAYMLKG